jgi:hypothetical protein
VRSIKLLLDARRSQRSRRSMKLKRRSIKLLLEEHQAVALRRRSRRSMKLPLLQLKASYEALSY